ncbi:MAG: hypothetical protein JKY93_01090 [Gammaproteobacteria bacterium]|nr:hypothetical protein [Gammaproteobacteria bacterium]
MSNYTDADLAAMDKAIGSGALEVEHGGSRVKYRSLIEMMQARDFIAKSMQSTPNTPNHTVYSGSKGL